jgi:predicted permease
MSEFIYIFTNVTIPIGIIVIIGYVVQLKYKLERATLAKLMINYVMPGFVFMNLYEADIDFLLLVYVLLFLILYAFVTFVLSTLISKMIGLDKGHTVLYRNANLFYNAGNYGVPVNDLVFRSDPFATSIQVMMVVFQNIFAFSYGIISLSSDGNSKFKALMNYFKMPMFYGLSIGLILNYFHVNVPGAIISAFDYIRNAMIGIVLFTLGAQIAGIKFTKLRKSAFTASAFRLLGGPILAFLLLSLFNVEGIVAQAIMITTSMPAAVNSSIIAEAYSDDPEYAAEIVMISTLFSALTIPLVVYIALNVF